MSDMKHQEEILEQLSNIIQKEKFEKNLRCSSLIVLFFEAFKDLVIYRLRDFYSIACFCSEEENNKESEEYKQKVRCLNNRNIFDASLQWFINQGAIDISDYQEIKNIEKRRNELVHELLKSLVVGMSQNDWLQLTAIVKIYKKVDSWWVYNIEADWDEVSNPEPIKQKDCYSCDAMMLQIILNMTIGNSEQYEGLIDDIKQALKNRR